MSISLRTFLVPIAALFSSVGVLVGGQSSVDPDCLCARNLTHESGDSGDGWLTAVTAPTPIGVTTETFTARTHIKDSDDGECYAPSDCAREIDPCNWEYDILCTIEHLGGNAQQLWTLHHRQEAISVDTEDEVTFSRESSKHCQQFQTMKVVGKDIYGQNLVVANLQNLVCNNCDAAE